MPKNIEGAVRPSFWSAWRKNFSISRIPSAPVLENLGNGSQNMLMGRFMNERCRAESKLQMFPESLSCLGFAHTCKDPSEEEKVKWRLSKCFGSPLPNTKILIKQFKLRAKKSSVFFFLIKRTWSLTLTLEGLISVSHIRTAMSSSEILMSKH